MRHSSEIQLGQESRIEQERSASKARVESAKRSEKRYTICEVSHIFDIVNTFFYIARIPAGWFCMGGENVRIFGSEARLPWNLGACVFWLPGVHVARGAQVANLFRSEYVGLRALGLKQAWPVETATSV